MCIIVPILEILASNRILPPFTLRLPRSVPPVYTAMYGNRELPERSPLLPLPCFLPGRFCLDDFVRPSWLASAAVPLRTTSSIPATLGLGRHGRIPWPDICPLELRHSIRSSGSRRQGPGQGSRSVASNFSAQLDPVLRGHFDGVP